MPRTPFRIGSKKERVEKKISGRKCVYAIEQPDGTEKPCGENAGDNFFFCRIHFNKVQDHGVTGV